MSVILVEADGIYECREIVVGFDQYQVTAIDLDIVIDLFAVVRIVNAMITAHGF